MDRPTTLVSVVSLLRGSLKYVLLVLVAAVFIVPFLWSVLTSFKLPHDITLMELRWLPRPFTFSNYVRIWTTSPFARYFLNSFIVAGTITVCSLMFSSLAGFAFAKYEFPCKKLLFLLVLGCMMVPIEVTAIPLYTLISEFGWIDTYAGLIVPWLVSVYGTFLMKQFIEAVPDELMDAARIDGCSEFRIWWNIILPVSKTGLSIVGLYIFIFTWNEFIWALLVVNSETMRTVQLGIAHQVERYFTPYGPLMASSVCAILPTTIVFLFLRKYIMESIALTGLKG